MVVLHPHHALIRPGVVAAVLAVTALTGLTACGSGATRSAPSGPTTDVPASPPVRTVTPVEAVRRGAAFVAPQFGSIDVASASLFDYLYRNWAVDGLAGVRPAIQQRLAGGGLVDDEALLVRLADPTAPVPEVPAGTEPTTAVLAAALHCDQRPLDAADEERLQALVAGGGYDTTHAALAVGWSGELGCPVPDGVRDEVVGRMAAELAAVGAEPLTDLSVEQSAVLSYLGAGDRVPPGWGKRIVDAQRPDGGWSEGGRPSSWHMTLLAIWTLEALSGPGSGAGIIAGRS